jgi:hypothetical protein
MAYVHMSPWPRGKEDAPARFTIGGREVDRQTGQWAAPPPEPPSQPQQQPQASVAGPASKLAAAQRHHAEHLRAEAARWEHEVNNAPILDRQAQVSEHQIAVHDYLVKSFADSPEAGLVDQAEREALQDAERAKAQYGAAFQQHLGLPPADDAVERRRDRAIQKVRDSFDSASKMKTPSGDPQSLTLTAKRALERCALEDLPAVLDGVKSYLGNRGNPVEWCDDLAESRVPEVAQAHQRAQQGIATADAISHDAARLRQAITEGRTLQVPLTGVSQGAPTGDGLLSRDDLNAMSYTDIMAAHRAGRININDGKYENPSE